MRICLNMIVRDESAILERCLRSVIPHVDCYVICDTGSTDDTVGLIRRTFDGAGIAGEVHAIAFEHFEQARNHALDLCRRAEAQFDYILFIDADMELVVERAGWRRRLSHPAYLVRQASGSFAYHNVRLLARATAARYVGATHEYLAVQGTHRLGGVHMLDHACGSSRSVKLQRDERLLTEAVARDADDARAVFYLAQTLREAGRHAEAVAMYERRAAMGGWDEEVWYARFMIARCLQAMGDVPRFVAACLEAYEARPSRAEPLHALAEHYRHGGQHDACLLLSEAAVRIPLPRDMLFVDEEVYRSGFRHQISISGYYSKDPARRERARALCAKLAIDGRAPSHVRELARANWRFYARSCGDLFASARFERLDMAMPVGFHPCNPSLTVRDGEIWCVVRGVDYFLGEDGAYHLADDGVIRSQSFLSRLDPDLRPRDPVPIVEDGAVRVDGAGIVGLEDIRVFVHGNRLRGSCTVADRDPQWQRRLAVFDLDDDGSARRLTLQLHEAEHHQKNWMPFVDEDGLGFVYWTDPTVVLRWDERTRQSVPWLRHPCGAALDNQRGGSGLVRFDEGWLGVTHEVSWVDGRRTYLHRILQFDATWRVRAATEPFYFRVRGIEFCGGLVGGPARGLGPDQLLLSFGVNDGEAWLVVLEAAEVRRCLRRVSRGSRLSGRRPAG